MPSEHTEGLLRIGEVARLFNLSVGTLRHYELMGVLDPARIDPASGYRYYGSRQLSTLNTISHLRVLDLPLAQIREFVTTRDVNLMQRQLAQQQKLIERKRRELERVSRKIDNRLALLHNALNIELDTICTIDAPELRCAVLRERVNPTADYALEQGKDVYVVPGRITDRLSDGCNRQLTQGAGVFLSPESFTGESMRNWEEKQELSSPDPAQKIRGRRKSRKRIEKLEEPLRQVYKLLDCVPKSTEIILQEAWKKGEYIDIVTLHRRLMELELMGYVKQNTPGYFGTSAN